MKKIKYYYYDHYKVVILKVNACVREQGKYLQTIGVYITFKKGYIHVYIKYTNIE